jgi:hypothetical protein
MTRSTPSRRSRASRRGYTAVEVLAAMLFLAIGAAGVIGMQKVTIQGGRDARNFDIATNIANEWLSRLQRDAMSWTAPNEDVKVSNLTTATLWLKSTPTGSCPQGFCMPPVPATIDASTHVGVGTSPAFDHLGRELPKAAGADPDNRHYFCTQYRLSWIANPGNSTCKAGAEDCMTALIRAEVRVFWQRLEYGQIGDCEALPVAMTTEAASKRYHFVYAATSIRENARNR